MALLSVLVFAITYAYQEWRFKSKAFGPSIKYGVLSPQYAYAELIASHDQRARDSALLQIVQNGMQSDPVIAGKLKSIFGKQDSLTIPPMAALAMNRFDLLRYLHHPDSNQRLAAVYASRWWRSAGKVEVLTKFLDDPDPNVLGQTVYELGHIGDRSVLAVLAKPEFDKVNFIEEARAALKAGRSIDQTNTSLSPVENLSFGPVIERVVADILAEPTQACLDFRSGEFKGRNMPLQQLGQAGSDYEWLELKSPFGVLRRWIKEQGVDLVGCRGTGASGPRFEFFGGFAYRLSDTVTFDNVQPREVIEHMNSLSTNNPSTATYPGIRVSTAKLDEQVARDASFIIFHSQDGDAGVLQITGFTENPRRVKIRYKLVQGAKLTPGADNPETPAKAERPRPSQPIEQQFGVSSSHLISQIISLLLHIGFLYLVYRVWRRYGWWAALLLLIAGVALVLMLTIDRRVLPISSSSPRLVATLANNLVQGAKAEPVSKPAEEIQEQTPLKVTKEQVAQIETLLKNGPVTTDYLAAIFEHDETSGSSYRRRADVVAIPIHLAEKSASDTLPLGEVLHLTGDTTFYVQWDEVIASTLHYYGPYDGSSEIAKALELKLTSGKSEP